MRRAPTRKPEICRGLYTLRQFAGSVVQALQSLLSWHCSQSLCSCCCTLSVWGCVRVPMPVLHAGNQGTYACESLMHACKSD